MLWEMTGSLTPFRGSPFPIVSDLFRNWLLGSLCPFTCTVCSEKDTHKKGLIQLIKHNNNNVKIHSYFGLNLFSHVYIQPYRIIKLLGFCKTSAGQIVQQPIDIQVVIP